MRSNTLYLLAMFALTTLVGACGESAKQQLETAQAKTTPATDIVRDSKGVTAQPAAPFPATPPAAANQPAAVAQTAPASVAPPVSITPALPQGRLVGIVASEGHTQATIEHEGKAIRLKQGDDWQGWHVNSIKTDNLSITAGSAEHTLALHDSFQAPTASANLQNALAKHQQALDEVAELPPPPEGTPALELSQKQEEQLRSRLVAE